VRRKTAVAQIKSVSELQSGRSKPTSSLEVVNEVPGDKQSHNASSTIVGLTGFHFVTGSRRVDNAELIQRFPGKTPQDILQRTGIETRYFCGSDESVLSLATSASQSAMRAAGLTLADLDAILVSTSTPLSISPSLSCLLHHQLSREGPARDVPASDIYAACSGWLYALQTAFDQCQVRPQSKILVVTAEAMSRFLDPEDFDTAIVFGDAATATIVCGLQADGSPFSTGGIQKIAAKLHRPILSARGENGEILNMGRMDNGCYRPVEMHGVRVFPLAVRQMNQMLKQACAQAGWGMDDLQWIVPHQANGRIISAAQQRSGVPAERVISNVANYGNTSSSSIPLALSEMVAAGQKGKTAVAAFGGGFTFGASVLELV
jgi:2-oxoisovalerate dehydrogenase E1 component